MLALLEEIDDVEGALVNEAGDQVLLNLRPGANAEEVAGRARGVLGQAAGKSGAEDSPAADSPAVERGSVRQLGPGATAESIRREEWRDRKWIDEVAAAERRASVSRWRAWLLVLLAFTAVLLALLWWRHRRKKEASAVAWQSLPGSCANWGGD